MFINPNNFVATEVKNVENFCIQGKSNNDLGLNYKLNIERNTFLNGKEKCTVLLVDDENMIRKSIIRLINKYFEKNKKDKEVIIIECQDGIECITAIYMAKKKNIYIDLIISDENMKFINGSYSSKILEHLLISQQIKDIPMFISTA